jgi:hypothetical protein
MYDSDGQVFQLPQTSSRWGLVFFCSQLLIMNLAMPAGPAGLGADLGRTFFKLFWLGPILGTIFYLRHAKAYRLRIGRDRIEVTTRKGVQSFSYGNADLTVKWLSGRGVELRSSVGESRLTFREFHERDRSTIRQLIRERVPQRLQHEWDHYEKQMVESSAKTQKVMRSLSRFGSMTLMVFGVAIAAGAVVTGQLHLLVVATINFGVSLWVRAKAKHWLKEKSAEETQA